MIGYCSNSPSRCPHATQLTVLTEENHCCPLCHSPLLQVPEAKVHPLIEHYGFQGGLVAFMVLALLIVCLAFD